MWKIMVEKVLGHLLKFHLPHLKKLTGDLRDFMGTVNHTVDHLRYHITSLNLTFHIIYERERPSSDILTTC